MLNEQTVILNVVPSGVPPVVHVGQNDVGRVIHLVLKNGNNPLPLLSRYSYEIRGTKASGTGFVFDEHFTQINSNTIQFKTTATMTAAEGPARCGLLIFDGDEHVETLNFIMDVQRSALSPDDIIDASDFGTIINDAVEDVLEDAVHAVTDDLEDRVETLETASVIIEDDGDGNLTIYI